MHVEVLMPKMGESITEGRILKWVKKPGDQIQRDETIAEISTDKVDTEVPSPESGVIVKILAMENDTVEVNKPIAIIETDAADASMAASSREVTPSVRPEAAAAQAYAGSMQQTSPPVPPSDSPAGRFYSPVVMRMAAEQGIGMDELSRIGGTGIGGRVTKQDLITYIGHGRNVVHGEKKASVESSMAVEVVHAEPMQQERTPHGELSTSLAATGTEIVPMDNMHRIMAEHMVRSKQTSPHVTLVSEVDMTAIAQFRQAHAESFKTREGFALTFMPFIADAAVRALKDFPFVNASIEGTNIVLKKQINVGIAVALDTGGLIVPVIRRADELNLIGLGRAIHDVASRARKKRLQPEEIQGGTFSITNYGVFGNLFGTPIINQPQVAILGVGAVKKRPVVIERDGMDLIAVRSIMYLSLSFDHRLVDGALGGMFLERVVSYLHGFSLQAI